MNVPYLQTPPEVVPIDVGRQLFFDNFLIANTDLERKFYKPKKYAQNPILKPETALETSNIPGASAKDGGVWWEPREQIFKMWYEAGWLNKMAYATSNDGVNWVRPDLNNGSNELLTLSRFPQTHAPSYWITRHPTTRDTKCFYARRTLKQQTMPAIV